jgi:hypothetical protein
VAALHVSVSRAPARARKRETFTSTLYGAVHEQEHVYVVLHLNRTYAALGRGACKASLPREGRQNLPVARKWRLS